MNGLNPHRTQSCFDTDVTQCTQSHATAGVEAVQEPIGWPIAQLLLDHPKQIGADGLELEMRTVANVTATISPFDAAPLQGLRQQPAPLGQWLMGAGCGFANRDGHVPLGASNRPCDDVTTIGNLDLRVIALSLDGLRLMGCVEFGMETPRKHVESKFRDFRTNRKQNEHQWKDRNQLICHSL